MHYKVDTSNAKVKPGKLAILGSGETTGVGRRVLSGILQQLEEPCTIAVLDTPAAFQPNHIQVADKIAKFILERLAEFHPCPHIVETRRDALATAVGATILSRIANSRCIVAGPGSPTYMIRELKDTAYLNAIHQAHYAGTAIYVSSAASIAFSALSVPVYEIFKVGVDPYWLDGLDFLGRFGMRLAIVPHWNNNEGGAELDTRFCYMGQERFEQLRKKLPSGVVMLGIDEHTACIMDFVTTLVSVDGKGGVHIVRDGHIVEFNSGQTFPMSLLGADTFDLQGIGADLLVNATMNAEMLPSPATTLNPWIEEDAWATKIPPQLIDTLLAIRAELRSAKQWALADKLRDALTEFGIVVEDTPAGTRWHIPEME